MITRTLLSLSIAATLIGGCAGAPQTSSQKDEMTSKVRQAIESAKVGDPTMVKFFDSAYGYAVLPSVGKGGFIISGAGGDGEVYKGGSLVGYCGMGQGSIGLTAGGQAFDEFIFFKDKVSYDNFTAGTWALAAQATAVMVQAGGGAAADYQNGVAVFINNTEGAMIEASVGGQKFSFTPLK